MRVGVVSGRRWPLDSCSDEVDEDRKLTSDQARRKYLKAASTEVVCE